MDRIPTQSMLEKTDSYMTITLNKGLHTLNSYYCVGNINDPSTTTLSHLAGKNNLPTSLNSIESSNVIMNVHAVVFFITEKLFTFFCKRVFI